MTVDAGQCIAEIAQRYGRIGRVAGVAVTVARIIAVTVAATVTHFIQPNQRALQRQTHRDGVAKPIAAGRT